ncbi:SRPBCC family protein [Bacillus sp. EB01]|uniref:SRPBCC family protein n=1 Tax=Bacillus sp. EB01 TaxID=1347086 RepID=UPI0005C79063|nr:SRPBCC family protein [Bacillus sp. EB01]
MADFEASVIIRKPIEEVYEYVSNMENMSEFMPNVVKIDKPSDGFLTPGDKVLETRMIRGREMTNELEIVENEKNKHFSYRSDINGLQSTYRYRFSKADGGTNAHFEAIIKTTGLRMRITKRFIVDMLKREDGNQMSYLKDALEGTGPSL